MRPTTPWCGRSMKRPGSKPNHGSTPPPPQRHQVGDAAKSSVSTPRHRSVVRRFERPRRHRGGLGLADSSRSANFVEFLGDLVAPRHLRGWSCTPSSTTSQRMAPPVSRRSSMSIPTCSCATPRHVMVEPGRVVLLDHAAPLDPIRRVRLRRPPHRPNHRVHQDLQPTGPPVPLDIRRPTTTSRVTHNDLRGSTRAPSAPPTSSVGPAIGRGKPRGVPTADASRPAHGYAATVEAALPAPPVRPRKTHAC